MTFYTMPQPAVRRYDDRRRAYDWALRASLLVILPATALRRLNPFGRRASPRLSLVSEARASAAAVVPFIFMG